jgi:hypothetical protein
MKDKEENFKHPSYGQIRFARIQGRAKFYGSELTQDHYISMTVQSSEVRRELGRDWYFASGLPLIEIRMTSSQFAEMITTMNHAGIPCTVEMLAGKPVEELPEIESRKEYTHRAFQDRMDEFAVTLGDRQKKALELIKKKTLSKEDVNQLRIYIEWMTQEISSNIPFFAKCFQETMDKVVVEAKAEVENAIQHKINVLGLQKLHEENNLLESGPKDDKKKI